MTHGSMRLIRRMISLKKSDHFIVFMEPISVINNQPARTKRQIFVRKFPQSKVNQMGEVLKAFDWSVIYKAENAHIKAELGAIGILNSCRVEAEAWWSCMVPIMVSTG